MDAINDTADAAAATPPGECVPGANEFHSIYVSLHGYITIVICILGSLANSVNIAVLSRKEMASSTNSILTGLAVADLLVMLEYIPFALHVYVRASCSLNRNTYGWAVFVYFHSIFSQTFHTISIWLTIALAVWRFIAIKFPQRNRTWCDKKNTTLVIVGAYVICPVLCLPIYFAMNIHPVTKPVSNLTDRAEIECVDNNQRNGTLTMYEVRVNSENATLMAAIFWIYSVILKLIPCIVLSFLSVCLVMKMKSSERKRQKLLKKSTLVSTEAEKARLHEEGGGGGGGGKRAPAGRTDRTTRMLLVLLGLFLLTEFPQGLFGLLSAIAPRFFEICYNTFADLMDLLALVGSAINFVLYCSMSRQFRMTFERLARKALPLPDKGEPLKPMKDGVTEIKT